MREKILLILITMLLLLSTAPIFAQENDPASQCAVGVDWYFSGRSEEALPLVEAGFSAHEKANFSDLNDLGLCALVLGILRAEAGNFDTALEAYAVARSQFSQTDDRYLEGKAINNIAWIYHSQERFEEALTMYEESLVIAREVEDWVGESITLNNIIEIHKVLGNYDELLNRYDEALDLYREIRDQKEEAKTLSHIADVYYFQERYEEALSKYEQSLVLARKLDDQLLEGNALRNIGAIYLVLKQYDNALTNFEEALSILRDLDDRKGEGTTLHNIAAVYHDQDHFEEALNLYEESLSIATNVGDWAGAAITRTNIADIYLYQERYDAALIQYKAALAIYKKLNNRIEEGATLNNIAGIYFDQEQYEKALNWYEMALIAHRETSNKTLESIALNNVALIYHSQGRYEAALTEYENSLAIASEEDDREGEGTTLHNIAGIYLSQGHYEKALATYDEALKIRREMFDRVGEGITLTGIGLIYHALGRYEEAMIQYELSLAILREEKNLRGESATLHNVGLVYHAQGRFQEALAISEEALTLTRDVNDRKAEGETLHSIAEIYRSQGHYEEALSYHEEALFVFREIGDRTGEGIALTGIAGVYESQRQFEKALSNYGDALAILREVGNRAGEGTTLNNIGLVYQAQGRLEEALSIFEDALVIACEVGDRAGEGITLNNIGFVYQIQERDLEALSNYEKSLEIFESIRAVSGNDLARASFITQYSSLYYRLLDLYEQEKLLFNAFQVSELGRARSFGDALATGSVQLVDGEAESLISTELSSYNMILAAEEALSRAYGIYPPDSKIVTDLEVQLQNANDAHNEALAAIESRKDRLIELVPSRKTVLELSETQAFLDELSTLVSFWVLEDRLIVFILTRSSFDVIAIEVADEALNTQVKAFHDFTEIDSVHPDSAITLHNTLITPIRSYLNTPHLIIVPHQALHYVPFAALTDGERYLMDDFAITYLPNASMLQFLPDADEQPTYDTALILGNPVASTADDFNTPLSNLPNAEQSAQTIAAMFNTVPLLTDVATETAVSQNVSTANILHLGAHGRYNTVAPMQSAIYLTPGVDETDVGDNGRLRVDEVYGLPLDNIELVVLSACETNLGHLDRDNPFNNISAGDEIVSLNRAFLFQSPTVISTLWTVDDAATGLLMEKFYTYLLEGKSKADALRLAQMDVRKEYTNPYFWAGFILSGDGGEVDIFLLSKNNIVTEPSITPESVVDGETAVPSSTVQPPQPDPTPAPSLIIWLVLVVILAMVGGFVVRWWWNR